MHRRIGVWYDGSSCPFEEWLATRQPQHSAGLRRWLLRMEQVKDLKRPHAAPLKGKDYRGLWEFRKEIQKVAYRPLFTIYDDVPIILLGAVEKENKFVPANALSQAMDLVKKLKDAKDGSGYRWFADST